MEDKKYVHYELHVPFGCLTDDVKLRMQAVLRDFKIRSECIQCGQTGVGYVFIVGLGADQRRARLFKAAMSEAVDEDEYPPVSEREATTDETWDIIKSCQIGIQCPIDI